MADPRRRLSEADAYFLPMSRAIGMATAGVAVGIHAGPLDPDLERHYRLLHARLLPATGRRIAEDPWSTALPRWVDVPGFDPDDHWEVLAPPGDGTIEAAYEWAAGWARTPMPADRPPWRAVRIDGVVVDGAVRTVTFRQMHHAVLDGGGAVRLAQHYFRAAADEPHPALPDPERPEQITALERWREGWALEGAKARAGLRANGRRLRWAAAEPRAAARRTGELAAAAVRLQRPVGAVPLSPLLRGRSDRLRFDRLALDADAVRAGAKAAGGTFNDGLMAATSVALRRWHLDQGVQVPAVRTAMAVDRRPKDGTTWSGNDALAVVVHLPTDEDDLASLVARCSELSRVARSDDDALWLIDRARASGNRMPRRLATALTRRSLGGLDVSISNVRGATTRQWEAGAERLDGWGFIVGTLSPIAMLVGTRASGCSLGLTTCPVVIPKVEPLIDHLRDAFAALGDLA